MGQVMHPDSFPYHCVGLLQVTLEGGVVGWGTGTLIDEKYVITCGHNIVFDKRRAIAAKFHPAYSSPKPPPTGGFSANCGFVKHAFLDDDRSWDIGVYRLSNSPSLKKYMQLRVVEHGDEPLEEMMATGYPSNHHYSMWEEQELVSGFNVAEHVFAYTHPTSTGSSGSPLYRHRDGNACIYGIHSGRADNRDEDRVGVLITEETSRFVHAALQWGPTDRFVVDIK